MDKEEKDFYLHKNFGVEPNKPSPKKVINKVFQLTYIQTNQRIIHGTYALCMWELNKQPKTFRKKYKIEPFKS